MDSACPEASQELKRVQISQLMVRWSVCVHRCVSSERGLFNLESVWPLFFPQECGFTREQSSKALIFHGSVEKALEALLSPGGQPGERPPLTSCQLAIDAVSVCFTLLLLCVGAERSGSHRRQDHPTKEVEVKPNQSVASKTTAANQQPPQWVHLI